MANLKRYEESWVSKELAQHCGVNELVLVGPYQQDGPYVDSRPGLGASNSYAPVVCLCCGMRGQHLISRDGTESLTMGDEVLRGKVRLGHVVLAAP